MTHFQMTPSVTSPDDLAGTAGRVIAEDQNKRSDDELNALSPEVLSTSVINERAWALTGEGVHLSEES